MSHTKIKPELKTAKRSHNLPEGIKKNKTGQERKMAAQSQAHKIYADNRQDAMKDKLFSLQDSYKVSVSMYNNKVMVNVRIYNRAYPTKKGVTMYSDEFPEFIAASQSKKKASACKRFTFHRSGKTQKITRTHDQQQITLPEKQLTNLHLRAPEIQKAIDEMSIISSTDDEEEFMFVDGMIELIRNVLYAIANIAYEDARSEAVASCTGCLTHMENQMGHACVMWDEPDNRNKHAQASWDAVKQTHVQSVFLAAGQKLPFMDIDVIKSCEKNVDLARIHSPTCEHPEAAQMMATCRENLVLKF